MKTLVTMVSFNQKDISPSTRIPFIVWSPSKLFDHVKIIIKVPWSPSKLFFSNQDMLSDLKRLCYSMLFIVSLFI